MNGDVYTATLSSWPSRTTGVFVALCRGPIDDGDVEVNEVGGVVRRERGPETSGERGDQEVGIIMCPTMTSLVCSQLRRRDPYRAVIVDPVKGLGEGVELRELTIGATVE